MTVKAWWLWQQQILGDHFVTQIIKAIVIGKIIFSDILQQSYNHFININIYPHLFFATLIVIIISLKTMLIILDTKILVVFIIYKFLKFILWQRHLGAGVVGLRRLVWESELLLRPEH